MNNVICINLSYENFLILFKNNDVKILNKNNCNFKLENILYLINFILLKNNIKLNDINSIICITGPGKFIGTRIGILLSIGLSIDKNIPIITISIVEISNYILKYIYNKNINNLFYIIKLSNNLFYFKGKKNIYYIYNFKKILNIINILNNFKNKLIIIIYKSKKILKFIKKKYLYIKNININIIYNIYINKIYKNKINYFKSFNIFYK
ncbi:hypothetical protein [Candidatus Nardonella dryophthoridicola]|uniref:hypothetical protein n=1 Tax=Candidatus Nardonella dryophthoridicola TaxID=1971485 RepID=UPI001AD86DB7|nr:hypothetical protein [Candidatus Nardonella dryophthoridicola]QTJ62814.1 hypothetical protein JRY34_00730 [Candidatus Nardonella dryophthoridicola]